jgi:cell division protein FtsA
MGVKNGELIVGLDVGTSTICVVVGEVNEGKVDIIGVGNSRSKGLKKGVVVNMESTVESIKRAVGEAEMSAGVAIKAVYAGTAGGHIKSIPSNGIIAVKDKEIGQREIDRVIEAARAVAIPFDREILHVIPVGFTVNGQNGITDPRGMEGVRLEANVRIVTGSATSVHNLIRSCQKAGLDVIEVVFEPLASAEAILSQDEKEIGVAIVDIGGGTTDIAMFQEGNICHTAVFSLGGSNFTNDIAIGLRTLAPEAETIKRRYGSSMLSLVKEDEDIEIGYEDERQHRRIPRRYLVEIIQPRAEELFALVREEIRAGGFHNMLSAGIVLTGGAASMEGMDIIAENMLELPVRIGNPTGVGGITGVIGRPEYVTGAGLVIYGAKEIIREQRFCSDRMFYGMVTKMKGWAKETLRLASNDY